MCTLVFFFYFSNQMVVSRAQFTLYSTNESVTFATVIAATLRSTLSFNRKRFVYEKSVKRHPEPCIKIVVNKKKHASSPAVRLIHRKHQSTTPLHITSHRAELCLTVKPTKVRRSWLQSYN